MSILSLLTKPFLQARNPRLLIASTVIGVAVALLVAVFKALALGVFFDHLLKTDIWILAVAPVAGIVLARALLLIGGSDTSSSTSDEYIRAFHERHPRIPIGELPIKLLAGIATIGSGGAVGLEGPSIYAGPSLGLFIHERLNRFFRRDEAHILLTAGAAAGVSAVFKTPATGVLFAIEAPYRNDVTPQALVPSLIASAASYTTLVALSGSEPVIPFLSEGLSDSGTATRGVNWSVLDWNMFDVRFFNDLWGALILGVMAGLAGRVFAWLVHRTKRAIRTTSWLKRAAVASTVLVGLVILSKYAFGDPLSLGPGIEAMEWVFDQEALGPVALLFVVRVAATLASVYGGGVGGLFIPLCVLGVIVGQFVGLAVDHESTGLYPTLGLAAFLSSGYRTPIAAVMFVAESTRGVGAFVVPALIAAAVSQVVGGPSSVAEYQQRQRLGHIESRLMLPLSSVINVDVFTVPPDATVSEFVYVHVLGRRERMVPVVSGMTYLGMARLADVSSIDRDQWEQATVESIMAPDLPIALPSWTLRDAVVAMEISDIEMLAVTDDSNNFIGTVTGDDVLRLGEILDETEEN